MEFIQLIGKFIKKVPMSNIPPISYEEYLVEMRRPVKLTPVKFDYKALKAKTSNLGEKSRTEAKTTKET